MTRRTLRLNLGPRSYDIVFTENDAAGLESFVRPSISGQLAFIVADSNTRPIADRVAMGLAGAGFRLHVVVIPPGESEKALSTAQALLDALIDADADRHTLIVAVGGGVIGDLAGFVAAIYARGVPLLMVPTTLLAMVDSSIGGKVAVNHPRGKNLIGAIHQPVGVWIDVASLRTLPAREYRGGLAEVVKYGLALDPELFADVEERVAAIDQREPGALLYIVEECCRIKARIVEQDERDETGVRAVLNLGHTFAHAFETVAGYGAWRHGEAVAAGLVCACRLAEARSLIPAEVSKRVITLIQKLELPVRIDPWPPEELLAVMRRDKKAVGSRPRFIVPIRLGQTAMLDDVTDDEVRHVLEIGGQAR